VLLTCCFFRLPAGAESPAQTSDIVKTGAPALLGLARGEELRYTAFNPGSAEGGGEPIGMKMKLYDATGNVIAESAQVVIPPREFRSVDFKRDDLALAGEPRTGLLQVRTTPVFFLRNANAVSVTTSLELTAGGKQAGAYKFFFIIEALP
jgi:hypothetical protein